MSEVQKLRDMLKPHLTPADEGMITDQDEETCHLKEENKRDMQQLLVIKEETLPEHEDWNLSDNQEDTEEEEKLWISQQGEQFQKLQEANLTKFGFTTIPMKSENDDEKPETSQRHQSRNYEDTEAEPVASSSSVHRTLIAESEGEDDGGLQPDRNSGPNFYLQRDTSDMSSDSSGAETDDSDDWKQIRELQSSLNYQTDIDVVSSNICNIAEKEFNFSKSLKASAYVNKSVQQGRQASGKPFSCSGQSKKQKQKDTFHKHIRIHKEQKQLICSECGKSFGPKSKLDTHMVIHTGQKEFVCSECGQRFGLKGNLTRHMMIHTGQKPFTCSECGQTFGRKSHLNMHMIIHTGQKPFGCSECGQRFGEKSHLNRHMIIHTGQKPFSCSECGQRFAQKCTLIKHMIIHTGQKPFGCSECGKRFRRTSNLNRHLRIHTTSTRVTERCLSSASIQLGNLPGHQSTDAGPQQTASKG